MGSRQILWISTGRNKTLPPPMSLPVMGEIAGVNAASVGGCLLNSRLGPDGAERFNDELNGHVFDLERDGLRQVVPCP